jgi:hypothetical protein
MYIYGPSDKVDTDDLAMGTKACATKNKKSKNILT